MSVHEHEHQLSVYVGALNTMKLMCLRSIYLYYDGAKKCITSAMQAVGCECLRFAFQHPVEP